MTMTERIHSPDSYHAPWEKTFGQILTPFEEFIHRQTAGGVVLMVCTVIATARTIADANLATLSSLARSVKVCIR